MKYLIYMKNAQILHCVGPFDTKSAARAWQESRERKGIILPMFPPNDY